MEEVTMNSRFCATLVAAFCLGASVPAHATIQFALLDAVSHSGTVVVTPGVSFSAVVLGLGVAAEPASGVGANLDSFTYRVMFSTETFALQSNTFAAPFDNNPAPTGFNGSVPWAGLPVSITNSVDTGSPGGTPFVADLYRTTATRFGDAATDPEFLIETLGLIAPHTQGVYAISLQVLEAADSFGTFHFVGVNPGLTVQVVPEPSTPWLVASGLLALFFLIGLHKPRGRRQLAAP